MNNIFKDKKLNKEKLLKYGFRLEKDVFSYTANILSGEFQLIISIQEPNLVDTKMIDTSNGEIYTLHLTDSEGSFVGQIREEYNNILQDILEKCFSADVFKSKNTIQAIEYIQHKYGDELEFLWKKFAGNAVVRRADNKKWYAVFITISAKKLGLEEEKQIEIIDLRAKPDELPELLKQNNIYPGYHMNKKHWITILPDSSINIREVFSHIDKSYNLAKKK